jgi:hypothetical protein
MIRVTESQEGDRTGRALLTRLAAKGVRLLATWVHTFYIVRALMSVETRAPVSPSTAAGASGEGTSLKFEGTHG